MGPVAATAPRAAEVIARHLHAPDGVRFVTSTDELSGVDEPWVGLVPPGADVAAFAAPTGCLGLWVLGSRPPAGVPVPVAVLPDPAGDEAGFLDAVARSAIYRSLPVPPSRRGRFGSVDATVLVCSHSRVPDLGRVLECLTAQDWPGTFEVVVWNNNAACVGPVDEICSRFRDRLRLTVIHSGENYHCLPRLAVTPLMRSDVLLTCDDDVLPGRGFVTRFLSRFERYGPDAALCARGHVFLPHTLDEERPERAWAEHRGLQFFDEHDDDRPVHFLHASTSLVPKRVLRAALGYEMDQPEFALVDDYWLSFVLGHHLGVPVWKIRAGDVVSFTPSSDDPAVAMFHDPAVRRERVRFYIHHMRAGWPDFGPPRPGRRRDRRPGRLG